MTVMLTMFVIVPVLVLALIISGLYMSVSKRKSHVMPGLILAGIHLVFVLFAAHGHYAHKSEFPGLDFLLYFIDMPISLTLNSVAEILGLSDRAPEFYFVYFGVLGTIQYFLLGLLLGFLLRRNIKGCQ
jgi:hypothetical protein